MYSSMIEWRLGLDAEPPFVTIHHNLRSGPAESICIESMLRLSF